MQTLVGNESHTTQSFPPLLIPTKIKAGFYQQRPMYLLEKRIVYIHLHVSQVNICVIRECSLSNALFAAG
jgi:hypothetical protein